jgi:hypothetical protein
MDSAVAVIVVTAAIWLGWDKPSASVRHSSAALASDRRDRASDSPHSSDDRSRAAPSALSWCRARTVTSARTTARRAPITHHLECSSDRRRMTAGSASSKSKSWA